MDQRYSAFTVVTEYRLRRVGDSDEFGPYAADEITPLLKDEGAAYELQRDGGATWLTATSWAISASDANQSQSEASKPSRHQSESLQLPDELASLSLPDVVLLRWWLRDGGVHGPLGGKALLVRLRDGVGPGAAVSLVGASTKSGVWFPPSELLRVESASLVPDDTVSETCNYCLEELSLESLICPHCAEPTQRHPSLKGGAYKPAVMNQKFWRQHWRPAVTLAAVFGLLAGGVGLRQFAPEKYEPPLRMGAPSTEEPSCAAACWPGEACVLGKCEYGPSGTVGHIGNASTSPGNQGRVVNSTNADSTNADSTNADSTNAQGLSVAGPFELPRSVTTALPLDDQRVAVAQLKGVMVVDTSDGSTRELIIDAPHVQSLTRVADVIYATAPHRIYVIDAATTRVLKTLEMGGDVSRLAVSASGRRVLAAVPERHAVSVIATEYHAEVSRFFFGDDKVRGVVFDDAGTRALTTNGYVPLDGLHAAGAARFGAVYAFDPSRLPTEQDRVRTGLPGNPAAIVTSPDAKSSYVVLRKRNELVRLSHLPSGEVRQLGRTKVCLEPEDIKLVPLGRRAIVRCDAGRAVQIVSLETGQVVKEIKTAGRVSDLVVSPDSRQAVIVVAGDGAGEVALVDLVSYAVRKVTLKAEPHRVRLTPDGKTAVVLSNRSKAIWVLR